MRLLIKEYHDVVDTKDVTIGVFPTNEYEIDSGMIFNNPEIHKIMHQMMTTAERNSWDWVQFHNQDRMILYHGQVITGEEDNE